jgi:hypothetical protein
MIRIQELAKRFHDTFFNLNNHEVSGNMHVDARDIGMVARYTGTINPNDGWLFFITDAVTANERQHDAFKITEEGYTRFEARLLDAIQTNFRERTGLVVSLESIYKMEREANAKADYYSQLAKRCEAYEASHAPNSVPVNPIKRTIN